MLRGRLPPVASVVGLDPESEMLFAATPKGEVLGFDLESGRVDTVATGVEQAALGPDGTLFTVDAKKRVVSLERRVRFAWPQPLSLCSRVPSPAFSLRTPRGRVMCSSTFDCNHDGRDLEVSSRQRRRGRTDRGELRALDRLAGGSSDGVVMVCSRPF